GAARLALLILVAVLSVRAMNGPAALAWPALLAVAAIPAMLAGAHPILGPLARFAEVVLTSLAAGAVATATYTVPSGTGLAAVLSASGGGRLVVLAQIGADRVDWETALDTDSAIADAWADQQPQTSARSQARSAAPGVDVSALVVPLVAGVRTVGLIAMETDTAGAYPPVLVAEVTSVAAPAALRLEAALLFDEVR